MKPVQTTFKGLFKARRRSGRRDREVPRVGPADGPGELWYPAHAHRRHNPWRRSRSRG